MILFRLIIFLLYVSENSLSFHTSGYYGRSSLMLTTHLKAGKAFYLNELKKIGKLSHRYFFPGHGGQYPPSEFQDLIGQRPFLFDLPELEELDNVHHPEGSLKKSLKSVSSLFQSKQSWYLVNGGSGGILTAMFSARELQARKSSERDVFLVPRNSHKSVFNGVRLTNSRAILVPVEFERNYEVPIGPYIKFIEEAIHNYRKNICALVLTRPTYQGIYCSNDQLRNLIEHCHANGVLVIVDEAHGSHLKFLGNNDALSCGADLVVQSWHKTLNSFSQTGALHLGKECSKVLNLSKSSIKTIIHNHYSALTTTSPNSLFLASLDATQSFLWSHGNKSFENTSTLVLKLKESLRSLPHVHILDDEIQNLNGNLSLDNMKLNLQFRNLKGDILDSSLVDEDICKRYGILCELNLPRCITYVFSPGIQAEALKYLYDSIAAIKNSIENFSQITSNSSISELPFESSLIEREAILQKCRRRKVKLPDVINGKTKLVGEISAETLAVYPPGIPFLVRGEKITESHVRILLTLKDEHYKLGRVITGMESETENYINILQKKKLIL